MALSFASSATATSASIVMPTHAAGNLLVVVYGNQTTAALSGSNPTWATFGAGGANSSLTAYWKIATTSSEAAPSLFTPANATMALAVVYSGNPAASAVGVSSAGTGSANLVTFPGFTFTGTNRESWGFHVASRTSITGDAANAPSGFVTRVSVQNVGELAWFDTDSPASGAPSTTGFNSASSIGYRSFSGELLTSTSPIPYYTSATVQLRARRVFVGGLPPVDPRPPFLR